MYYTHPGCRTSIFGENRAYCIRDFTVTQNILIKWMCRKYCRHRLRNWSTVYCVYTCLWCRSCNKSLLRY